MRRDTGRQLAYRRQSITYRYQYTLVSKCLNRASRGKQVLLDAGCGTGQFAALVAARQPQTIVIGIDCSADKLSCARRVSDDAPSYVRGDASYLPIQAGAVDVIVALHVIEHLPSPERFFVEARRCLREKGSLLLATPNINGIGARVMKDHWNGYCLEHIALKSPALWKNLLEASGFNMLLERTTLLSGLPAFRTLPLGILNWTILAAIGGLRWPYGEAWISLWQKGR